MSAASRAVVRKVGPARSHRFCEQRVHGGCLDQASANRGPSCGVTVPRRVGPGFAPNAFRAWAGRGRSARSRRPEVGHAGALLMPGRRPAPTPEGMPWLPLAKCEQGGSIDVHADEASMNSADRRTYDFQYQDSAERALESKPYRSGIGDNLRCRVPAGASLTAVLERGACLPDDVIVADRQQPQEGRVRDPELPPARS